MNREAERKRAAEGIRQMAANDGLPVALVRRVIMDTMYLQRDDPDPEVRSLWEGFTYEGEEPTPEEVILWVKEKDPDAPLAFPGWEEEGLGMETAAQ